jgi:hypothetical protein
VFVDMEYTSLLFLCLRLSHVRVLSVFDLEHSEADGLWRIRHHWDCYPMDSASKWRVWGIQVNMLYDLYLRATCFVVWLVGYLLRAVGVV